MISKIDECYDGTVTGITSFGAFVKMSNGESGMVHISEVSIRYVKDINDLYKVGDAVRVKVIGIKDEKIALSIRKAAASDSERPAAAGRPHNAALQTEKGPASFEEMMNKYKKDSEEKISSLRRQGESARPRRRKP